MNMLPDLSALAARLAELLGPKGVLSEPADITPRLTDWRGAFHGKAPFIACPASTGEVAAVVSACADMRLPIVPQGGLTGLCGGATPDASGTQIPISLHRMNKVRSLDPDDDSLTVEAGCILADIQTAADTADRLFPLSLGAEGTCQIGGNLATNAGGNAVLRYGNMRDLVLGLEVVLADGQVWSDLRGLRKNNTGFDLKQLFVGSEGSLGVITAATLKLFPRPVAQATAFVALDSLAAAMTLFSEARRQTGDQLVAFELVPAAGIDLARAHVDGAMDPLETRVSWYVLMEVASSRDDGTLDPMMEALLGDAFERGLVVDGTIAANAGQRAALWFLREAIVEGQRLQGASIKHDVSVRVSRMGQFIDAATAAVAARFPDDRVVAFGHVGDGNVHFNVCQPADGDRTAFEARAHDITDLVYDVVADFDGSISAEHGLGRLKSAAHAARSPALPLDLMRRIKAALDPDNIMNPNVIFPPPA